MRLWLAPLWDEARPGLRASLQKVLLPLVQEQSQREWLARQVAQ
jgi:hypothetical protein